VGHIITTIIGAGVLGLPHSMAWLGWVGGVLALVAFYVITLWCMWMLADVYEVKGRRHTRYMDAVHSILGEKKQVEGFCQDYKFSY
jgi:amino acid permease